jgi:hypothetical protein
MGYQHVENLKNARELVLREYEESDPMQIPDERYGIRLKYYDQAQLLEERKAYDVQGKSFEVEVQHLWDVLEMVYEDSKFMKGVVDFGDLAKRMRGRIKRRIAAKTGDPLYEDIEKSWDEITFVKPADTEVERMNRTYISEKDKIKRKLIMMKDKLQKLYGFRYPIQRRVMEDRLNFLEKQYLAFEYLINPYHIQPGLLLDVNITSIKRKKATLDGMANVLNEFLYGVSRGFQDAAFASFSRRRSTVRADIAQSFAGTSPGQEQAEGAAPTKSTEYLDMINVPAQETKAPARSAAQGVVDVPKRGGRKAAGRRGRPRKGGDVGLREI